MSEQEEFKECARNGCGLEALWGAEYCGMHIRELGQEHVDAWRRSVERNRANLHNANLVWAPLEKANLSWASLDGANLWGATLDGANLHCVSLQGANLWRASLQDVDLNSAFLQGADMREVLLKDAKLMDIKYAVHLRLPASVQGALVRFFILWGRGLIGKSMAVVEYAALPLAFALMPFVVLKMAWTGDAQWPFIFAPLWPIVSVMLLLHIHGWIWPAKTLEARAKKAFPEIFGDTDQPSSQRSAAEARWHKRLVQWIVSPTIWRGAAIDSAGPCNPIDLRYIKDQSYLEARMAAAESNWWSRLWMFIWGITCGYGSNIWLWIGWSLLLALSFGTTYFAGGNRVIVMEAIPGRSMSWYTPFYYSFVTFTTLGFGDVVPMNWAGELIVTVEVILGYVMLGGLVSILANKLARLA